MVNYNNGKIYKIEPVSGGEEGDIYVGSTTKQYLSQRMVTHRNQYNHWKKVKTVGKTSSFELFDKYGIQNCQITLLEAVEANSKEELLARERHFIQSLDCVNKNIAGRTTEEYQRQYRENNKEKLKQYDRERNIIRKDDLTVYRKQYYETNKEKINTKNKEYVENHKEKTIEYKKHYSEANKEKIAKYQKEWKLRNKEKQQNKGLIPQLEG